MTTAELIKALQEADPSGNLPVVVGNEATYFVETQEMYYDGTPVQLVQDHAKDPSWNIVGASFTSRGEKVRIHSIGIDDLLCDHPEMPVTYEDEYARRHCESVVEKLRAEYREMDASVAQELAARQP